MRGSTVVSYWILMSNSFTSIGRNRGTECGKGGPSAAVIDSPG